MKVLLVDDHPLILSALQSVIQGLDDKITVSTAHSADAAREALRGDTPCDLVLLDLNLGDDDGFDLLADWRAQYPALPVVVLSASEHSSDVIRALDMGAMGFVPKQVSNDTLVEALQQVLSGSVYVPAMAMEHGVKATPPLAQLGITPRQGDVLNLLLKGLPNKLIARELNLSVETVKDHVAAVLRALSVSSRTQAVIAVSQLLQKHRHSAPRQGPLA